MVVPGPFAHAQLVTAYAAGRALGEEVWGRGQSCQSTYQAQNFVQVYEIPPSKN